MSVHPDSVLRRHAQPITEAVPGVPLGLITPDLGWRLERRRARAVCDADFPEERRKEWLHKNANQFIEEEFRIDRARYRHGTLRIRGPFPHFAPQEPDIQVGERGATRLVARSISRDTSDNGQQDYVLEAMFAAPEYLQEIPTELAEHVFTQPGGRPGLRPLREREWRPYLANPNQARRKVATWYPPE